MTKLKPSTGKYSLRETWHNIVRFISEYVCADKVKFSQFEVLPGAILQVISALPSLRISEKYIKIKINLICFSRFFAVP